MTVQEEIQLQEYVKNHQAKLGCAEMKRRSRLLNQAQRLVNQLTRRLLAHYRKGDGVNRTIRALGHAIDRADRRGRAYYGA